MIDLKPGKTAKGVGWISQVQIIPRDATDPVWLSWTQWKEPAVAERHAAKLLERADAIASRVVRVDWTAGKLMEKTKEEVGPPAAGLDTAT